VFVSFKSHSLSSYQSKTFGPEPQANDSRPTATFGGLKSSPQRKQELDVR